MSQDSNPQEWMLKGCGASEPLCWIGLQQTPDKIDSGEHCWVRAGRPSTVQVVHPKVLRGRVGKHSFLFRSHHPSDLVSRENLKKNPADYPQISGKKTIARQCTQASWEWKLRPMGASVFANLDARGKKSFSTRLEVRGSPPVWPDLQAGSVELQS
jgi:hypothetical protein